MRTQLKTLAAWACINYELLFLYAVIARSDSDEAISQLGGDCFVGEERLLAMTLVNENKKTRTEIPWQVGI
jgi:hypothetical protein